MIKNEKNNLVTENKIINYYKVHKLKINSILSIFLSILILFFILEQKKVKENNLASEKYIKAGVLLNLKNNVQATNLYEEVITSNNKFYSLLALNTIIEKDLIQNEKKILKYFQTLEDLNVNRNNQDLILFKKALYLLDIKKNKEGKILLQNLINRNSILKNIAEEIIK